MIGLAIPMLNEEQNVQPVLEEICTVLTTAKIPFKIAAVNNGSSDGTHAKIIEMSQQNPNIIPIHLPVNQQYGGGILAGMRILESDNPTVIGWMWGDGQISPAILPTLYQQCQNGSDIAKAKRITRQDGTQRKIISNTYALVMSSLGIKTPDVNGCPKLFRFSVWKQLALQRTDWFLDAQAILQAEQMNLSITDHPATMKKRQFGKSKVNWKTVAEFSINIARWKWKNTKFY